jgi:tetratricopeptide (TPR) repeat protein
MIFISYRKADTQPIVDRLADRLKAVFGKDAVFKDDANLRAGERWSDRLRQEVLACKVLLAVIGPGWLTALDEDGRRRLDDPEDWVRQEISTAVEQNKRVIVLLANGAKMPTRRGLPANCPLQQLPELQAIPLRSGSDSEADLARLIEELRAICPVVIEKVSPVADVVHEPQPVSGSAAPLVGGMPALPPFIERLTANPVVLPREELLSEALRRLRQGPLPVLVLQGLTGIGKTLLMARIARTAGSEYDHLLALPLDGPAAVEPAYVIEEVNQFLARLGRGLLPEQLTRERPDRLLALLGTRLADLGVRVLVLLDAADAAVPSWAESLLRCLAKPPLVRLLATARSRLPGFDEAHLVVPPLRDEEALALVSEYCRVFRLDIDPATVVRRVPPAIRSHPQALVTLLAQLSDFPLEGLLDWGLPDEVQTPGRLVRQVVASLAPAARQVLAVARILSGVDLFGAARLLRLTPLPALRDLKTLLSRSLLYRVSEAGYVYVTPAIVGEMLAAEDPTAAAAAAELVAAGWRQARAADAAPPETLAPLGVRIAHNLTVCGRLDLVAGLVDDTFLERLNVRGLWKEYSLFLRLELEAARSVGERGRIVALGLRLTRKLAQTGDIEGARQALTEAESLADPACVPEQAELHSHRALLCGLRGDHAGALNEYLESRRLHRESGNRVAQAGIEAQLGKLYLMRHDRVAARAAFEATHELLAGEPRAKPRLEAAISLAVCDLQEGNLDAAEQALRAVLQECEAAGYEAGRARARLNLALILERSGKRDAALELARQVARESEGKDFAVARTAELMVARLTTRGNQTTEGKP